MGWRYVLNPLDGGYADGFERHKVYEFKHHGQDAKASVFRLVDQHPLFNVCGLMFRDPPSVRILQNANAQTPDQA